MANRRAVRRRESGWEHWDIPLNGLKGDIKIRFMTDSYSRSMDPNAPTWKWAIWGQPQLIELTSDGNRNVKYDFIKQIDLCKKNVTAGR